MGPWEVRAAVIELRSKTNLCRFTLYPMIHLADSSFYDAVAARLAEHDLVVAEGIRGKSRAVQLLTRTYRLAALNRKLGPQLQPMDLHDVGVPTLLPDITAPEFSLAWRHISLIERAAINVIALLAVLFLRLFGSREFIAGRLALDDDILNAKQPSGLEVDRLIRDRRDALLCAALTNILDTHPIDGANVAVVYGAGHVRPVVDYLRSRHGDVVSRGDWLTIFTLPH